MRLLILGLTFILLSGCSLLDQSIGLDQEKVIANQENQENIVVESGKLDYIGAIGGETTGFGLIKQDNSITELELTTYSQENKFIEGKDATVKGTFRTLSGIEIPQRIVLVVQEIIVQ